MSETKSIHYRTLTAIYEFRGRRGAYPRFLVIGATDYETLAMEAMGGRPQLPDGTLPVMWYGAQIVIVPNDLMPPGGVVCAGLAHEEFYHAASGEPSLSVLQRMFQRERDLPDDL